MIWIIIKTTCFVSEQDFFNMSLACSKNAFGRRPTARFEIGIETLTI